MDENIKILLAEDDPIDQMAFKRFVKRGKLPYSYVIAKTVVEAKKALATRKFDILLSDYEMGDGTALDLFDAAGETPVVVITGSGDEKIAVQAMQLGAYDYLIKDVQGDYLTALKVTVKKALKRKRTEVELKRYQEHLEELVEKRTRELRTINQQLELEIIESIMAKEKLEESEEKFRLLADHTHDWEYWRDPDGNFIYISPSCQRITGYSPEEISFDPNIIFKLIRPDHLKKVQEHYKDEINLDASLVTLEFPIITKNGEERWLMHKCFPIFDEQGEYIGQRGNNRDISERKKAEQMANRQLAFVSALHEIDVAINSSYDLNITLKIILEQTLSQLGADAAVIFFLDKNLNLLSYKAGIGFKNITEVQRASVKLGESFAGNVALENKMLLSDFESEEIPSEFLKLIKKEQFCSYAGTPLYAKGQLLGVLEVYKRTVFDPDEVWITFFETIAGQAAIAIDNISLFNDMQQSNLELSLGYEQTIEGWAKTLEMRDAETEGHSQRVTDLTLKLARRMGIKAEELVHVRRGALLHDIGKMNVPDSIMQKESELDGAEWEIMKKHTEYAYEFLSPIKFLKPALDIPQYHHERWDGSGYPHELKGEQIPLSARIFAIVDVYDALLSDRPYRKAWPMKKVINHLKEQSGKHFAPAVVEAFLEIQKNQS